MLPLGIITLISMGLGIVGGLVSENQKWNDANSEYHRQAGSYSYADISEDDFSSGTYYTKDADGNYHKATSYDANENYYTLTEEGTIDKERNQQLETLAENYQTEKDAVNENANLSEKTLNTSAKLAFDNLINNMSGQAESFNTAAMQQGQSTGNGLSAMAASGARSSSMATAVDLEKSVNAAQLDLQEKQTQNNNEYQIASILANLGSEKSNLQQSRRSYEEGGTAYRKYQTSVNSINNAYDNQLENLTYEYNKYLEGAESRTFASMLGIGSTAFSFLSNVDTSKVSWNNFDTSGNNGLLSSNWDSNFKNMSYLYGSSFI